MYPLAKAHLEINGHNIDVEASICDNLPIPLLLGADVPQLQDLIGQALCREHQPEVIEDVMAVTVRANNNNSILCCTKQTIS